MSLPTDADPTYIPDTIKVSVAPVAYKIIIEPGIGQFREFESPRVHTRIKLWELFLVHKLNASVS